MRDILEMLAGGGFVSGEKISAELGISRAAVWKRVEALRAQGYAIESAGRRGYRLVPGDALDPSLWKGALTTRELGRGEVRYQAEVSSTNTVLKEMAVGGAPQGSLCLCDRQTAGRVEHALEERELAEAIDRLCGTQARIKWPNDVVIQGKKCCGILLEMAADPDRLEYVVVGTGVNLQPGAYPPELKDRAISLAELTDRPPLRREMLCAYLAALEPLVDTLEASGFPALLPAYTARSCTLGSRVQVSGGMELTGLAESLDASGALMVRDDAGELHRVLSGDVSVRGIMGYV